MLASGSNTPRLTTTQSNRVQGLPLRRFPSAHLRRSLAAPRTSIPTARIDSTVPISRPNMSSSAERSAVQQRTPRSRSSVSRPRRAAGAARGVAAQGPTARGPVRRSTAATAGSAAELRHQRQWQSFPERVQLSRRGYFSPPSLGHVERTGRPSLREKYSVQIWPSMQTTRVEMSWRVNHQKRPPPSTARTQTPTARRAPSRFIRRLPNSYSPASISVILSEDGQRIGRSVANDFGRLTGVA
jgi:hypothetical protein